MKLLANQKVAHYIAAPMVGIGVLGGATLGLASAAAAATGDPGTSQGTSASASPAVNVFAPTSAGFVGAAA